MRFQNSAQPLLRGVSRKNVARSLFSQKVCALPPRALASVTSTGPLLRSLSSFHAQKASPSAAKNLPFTPGQARTPNGSEAECECGWWRRETPKENVEELMSLLLGRRLLGLLLRALLGLLDRLRLGRLLARLLRGLGHGCELRAKQTWIDETQPCHVFRPRRYRV